MEYYWNKKCSLCNLRDLFDVAQNFGGIASHDAIGGDVFGDHAARSDDGVLADGGVAENGGSRTDRCSPLDDGMLHLPVSLSLQIPIRSGCTRVSVINEHHTMTDEDIVLDRDPLANKGVTGDLASFPHDGILLNLDECTNFGFSTDFASVEIDELGKLHALPQLDVGANCYIFIHKISDVLSFVRGTAMTGRDDL